jgi:hypothetical protein
VGVSEAERPGQEEVAKIATAPSPTENPLTRLWEGADASYGHELEEMAALRERKRQKQEAPRSAPPRRGRRHSPAVSDAKTRVECERCRRTVKRAQSERVEIPSPLGEPTVRLLCSRCADEVRRGLLRLLAGQEPLPVPSHGEEAPLSIPARVAWFLMRMAVYVVIALVVFALVSWLSVH